MSSIDLKELSTKNYTQEDVALTRSSDGNLYWGESHPPPYELLTSDITGETTKKGLVSGEQLASLSEGYDITNKRVVWSGVSTGSLISPPIRIPPEEGEGLYLLESDSSSFLVYFFRGKYNYGTASTTSGSGITRSAVITHNDDAILFISNGSVTLNTIYKVG